jgi:hypothetical protein
VPDKGAGRVSEDTSAVTKGLVLVPPTSGAVTVILANTNGRLSGGIAIMFSLTNVTD